MIDLRIKSGDLLQYDEDADVVMINNNPTKNWSPVFVPNGNEEPTFFGFADNKNKKCYSIYGTVSDIHDEDSITL